MTTPRARTLRRSRVLSLAAPQEGVAHRRQLYQAGLTRSEVRAELAAGRWVRLGQQSIQVGPAGTHSKLWQAVFEVGTAAAVDGVSALIAVGLSGFSEDVVHVSVPKSARYRRTKGVRIHETRRRQPNDLAAVGLPRVLPHIAAIRAALWARSDRQAVTILAMVVQQRIVTAEDLWLAAHTVKRHVRRSLIRRTIGDLADGAQSLGELDFAAMCRKWGYPPPDRQTVRVMPNGRAYLDAEWDEYDAVVEIDGAQHFGPDAAYADLFRQNEVTLGDSRVLRVPVIAFRIGPDPFMAQAGRLLRRGGWEGLHSRAP
ncbi:hypothetical protein CLV47_101464 [Antricoccus suffuscus]|uniref:Transcriptional regulator, AbiEi antitoxin, Type IV TA system n=1 Tax=Antricoccus suffuscus TaxID=1629062 RepID=A0A2T1A7M0_9ACTN|nr:hypothetical protein [Antricoccus suffuscus]PRZ44338.1 hypothetical protein CLV47_101464 [Antricoccus suffuscus]